MTISRNDNLDQAKRIVRQQLQSLKMSGLQDLPIPTGKHEFGFAADTESSTGQADLGEQKTAIATTATVDSTRTRESKPEFQAGNEPFSDQYESSKEPLDVRIEKLGVIESSVSSCTKCPELSSCRNNTVFGVGNPQPELCFLGEGPGADEDQQGEPFVGQAGQLLNKIIAACKIERQDVYILNTVKCRPPGNRNPNDIELENCWPYAVEQLEVLQPKFICCLGSVAARTLLKTKQSIGKMRGQFFKFRGSQVIVTYHPAYLLRNPSAKRKVWDDMKMLFAAMGREI